MDKLIAIRQLIRAKNLADETAIVAELVDLAKLSPKVRRTIAREGAELVEAVRTNSDPSLMENFLGEFGLSTKEGIALMCLAEALLRIPDAETIDALIADKISSSNWDAHLGKASSSLVNASTWALMLTGRVLSDEDDKGLKSTLQNLVRRVGEPVIRTAVGQAMRELGKQFVLGETIQNALIRSKAMEEKGYSYSYDMLGEAAITDQDARHYHLAYADAITEIAKHASGDIRDNPGISVKLSALHPRYETMQKSKMFDVLVSRTKSLAMLAMGARVGFNIDAEEAARLDISLDVIEAVLSDPAFAGWDGFGIVVQAYLKRAAPVIDWLCELAKTHQRKIMVRLVKGAYWDSEIKHAQVMGLSDYPVFTAKQNTDISYIACAKKLLAMREHIYPQFATHNAHSVAAILNMAQGDHHLYEFQRLHGMGEALLDEVMRRGDTRCRIYAPVGAHKDLLAYLVRRLLENGANSSFVHQIVDETVSPQEIAADPFAAITHPAENPKLVLPSAIFGVERENSQGTDLDDPVELAAIEEGRSRFKHYSWHTRPLVAGMAETLKPQQPKHIINPSNHQDRVGTIIDASPEDIDRAIAAAKNAQPAWAQQKAAARAAILNKTADLYEEHAYEFYALLSREAGKTLSDCVGELREAVDFLRYYSNQAIRHEDNGNARGTFACISPWNFPLAIFTGQIAAALGAGNSVLAKPAEQTPLIAFRASQLLHQAGVPEDILQLLPGEGPVVGGALTSNANIDGVCFTGSTHTAQMINRNIATNMAPDTPFIAETGGLNVMIVDSTALPQQAIGDVLASAFQSAGQRCSACRLLYLQSDIAEEFLEMLRGAMDCLNTGDPWNIDTDIGPLVDQAAFDRINAYVGNKPAKGGSDFNFSPVIKPVSGIAEMGEEIFGPVLHVATFDADQLNRVVDQINAKGYGLTFGLHTRIDARVEQVTRRIKCGNIYINRNQIGAVVGSQPFGGEGLSGTGPKAGGPNYMARFMQNAEQQNQAHEHSTQDEGTTIELAPIQTAIEGISRPNKLTGDHLNRLIKNIEPQTPFMLDSQTVELPGPTGESNVLNYAPKEAILCLGPTKSQARIQALAALAAGCRVVVICQDIDQQLSELQNNNAPICCLTGRVEAAALTQLDNLGAVAIGTIEGQSNQLMTDIRLALAARAGPILSIVTDPCLVTSFRHERHTCIDTTAAGGNAALMIEAG